MVAARWVSLDEHSLAADELLGHTEDPDLSIDTGSGLTIVCFTNRSGSTWVCSQLSRLGLAGAPDQFHNYEFLNRPQICEFIEESGPTTFEDYLQQVIIRRRGRAGGSTIKATPMQLNHLIEHGTWARFDRVPTVIWSTRRNVVSQAVSHWTAVQDGRWTSLHTPLEDRPEPVLQYETVLDVARSIHQERANFAMVADCHDLRYLEVVYEDVAHSEDVLLDVVSRHAGVDPADAGDTLNPIESQRSDRKRLWEQEVRSRIAADARPGSRVTP